MKTSLTVGNIKEADLEIIHFSQRRKYSEEISALQKGDGVITMCSQNYDSSTGSLVLTQLKGEFFPSV